MLNFLRKIKFKPTVFLLIATFLFGNSLAGYALPTKAEAGPLYLKTEVRNRTDDTAYLSKVNAKPGDEIGFRYYVKNTSGTDVLNGVSIKTQLDSSLEYVPGTAVLEKGSLKYEDLPDELVTTGVELPEMVEHKAFYVFLIAKVKDGATGTIGQTTTVTMDEFSVTDSTASLVIGGDNQEIDPRLVVDTKAFNMTTTPDPGNNPERVWKDSVEAAPGETIGVYVLAFNDRPAGANSRLKDVMVNAKLDTDNDKIHINGKARANNHGQKVDPLRIRTKQSNHFSFVNGSVRLYYRDSSGTLVSRPLPDTVMADGVDVGTVNAGGQDEGKYVFFQLRVSAAKDEGTIQFEKHLFKGGEWLQTPDEDKKVTFVVKGPEGFERRVQANENGVAELTELPFGDYEVHEEVPAGYEMVEEGPVNFTLGGTNKVQKFIAQNKEKGEQPTPKGNLTVIKFIDANGNGVRDNNEGPQADVEFTITGLNGAVDLTMDTDAEGKIELTDLIPGDYTAKEIVPAGYEATTPTEQSAEVKADETATLTFGNKKVVTPPSPTPTQKGNLTVIKFIDANGNGVRDNNEGPQANVVFKVTGPDGYSFTGSTNADGKVELRDLTLGQYTAVETVPAEYEATTATTQSGQVKANETVTLTFGNKLKPTTPPQGGAPSLQLAKYVGNASRNEVADKTQTTAVAGDTLNWKVWLKNVGNESVKDLKVNDVLPANVTVTGDIVIIRDGQRFRFQDFTRGFVTIGDLAPNQEVTIEFATIASRDLACNNELINVVYAEAANHAKINAQAKAVIECVQVAGKQQPLVRTGSEQAIFSMILSMLAVAGYVYSRQRKTLNNMFGSL